MNWKHSGGDHGGSSDRSVKRGFLDHDNGTRSLFSACPPREGLCTVTFIWDSGEISLSVIVSSEIRRQQRGKMEQKWNFRNVLGLAARVCFI